jgi:hypothetical protein
LYVTSQNISISTLRRFIDIELESMDSIKLRVFEDVRLKINVSESWDGSYRRAGKMNPKENGSSIRGGINAAYNCSWGRLRFQDSGEYTITSDGTVKKGRYVFFNVAEQELLELRPEQGNAERGASENRTVYRVSASGAALILSRVRLGAAGVHDMLEGQIMLIPAESTTPP